MGRRHLPGAALLAVIVGVATLGASPTSAAADGSDEAAVTVSGGWVCVGGGVTNVPIDPDDPTGLWHFEAESASLLVGDFVGVDHTRASGTLDPQTGEMKGYIWETFIGIYASDGSAGTMTREGPFGGNVKTRDFRYNQRITGGDEDFKGSRGHLTVLGSLLVPDVPCVGQSGTYEGAWVRG